MVKKIRCSNCGGSVDKVCSSCWRCNKCCNCKKEDKKRWINGKITNKE